MFWASLWREWLLRVILELFIDYYIIDFGFLVTNSVYVLHTVSIYVISMSCQSSLCFSANTNSPLSLKFHRVWPLSPASFIYKAVIWNTMLMVCSPMLSVSTEPCGVANLSVQQCLEFDTQQNRVFSASGELITLSVAPQISLSPLNHYIQLNVLCNDQKDN